MDFTELTDLAWARLGGRVLAANDEFFGSRHSLLKSGRAILIPDKFTARGKWMDGWETRRRRTPGHDFCLVKLGLRGVIRGVDVDTQHFTGNYPERCSLEACDLPRNPTLPALARASWTEILPRVPLKGDARNLFPILDARPFTHVRLNIYPDGGVARLRVHGAVEVDWPRARGKLLDLAALVNGGRALGASDQHFGSKDNLILPRRAPNMGEGWETRRRRGPGHDWVVVELGASGVIEKVEVDTNHFKGNYPESCELEGVEGPGATLRDLDGPGFKWRVLLPRTTLRPHRRHFFVGALATRGPFTHVRLSIFPDGGVSRLRIHGRARLA
jgi:allantoicase